MTFDRVTAADMDATADVRVADVVRRFARERPEHVALRHGDRELTYAQLDERSSRLAQALLVEGLGVGSRVAYLGRSAPEVIELLFAVAKLGAVIVPLNWRLSPRELGGVLADAQARLLVSDSGYRQTAEALAPRALRIVGDDYEDWLRGHDAV